MTPAPEAAITAEWTVEEVITRFPPAARAFLDRGMHCVGCDLAPFETLAEACRIYGHPVEPMIAELRLARHGSRPVHDQQPTT